MHTDYTVEEVVAFTEETLSETLQQLDNKDREVAEVIPHRSGKEIDASVVTRPRPDHHTPMEWHVERAVGYGDDLETTLQRLSDDGWDIFTIIPHRIKTENFPEIIACRPK